MKKNIRKAKPLILKRSTKHWNKALEVIPGGSQTFSKSPFQHVNGVSPKIIKKAKGCYSWDVDGNKFIDYMMSLGPNILGYADPTINKAAMEAARDGVVTSLSHPLEYELAKLMTDIIPSAEMVRFGKNGSDVTTAAIRVARAFTGKNKILVCGYHGWHDWFIGSTPRNLGVPREISKLTLTFEYNNIKSLKKVIKNNKNQIAAIIMEPVNFYEPTNNFLENVSKIAKENRILLIYDEIITGFRMNIGGAQSYYKITPDLSCFGKALGNGYPISALVGRKEIMKLFNEAFFSGTFAGELISISAAIKTIKEIKKRKTINHINNLGAKIKSGYRKIITENKFEYFTNIIGFNWWPEYIFFNKDGSPSLEKQSLFQQEIIRRGVLTRAGMFICGSHSEKDIQKTLGVFEEALDFVNFAIKKNKVLEYLDGEVIVPVIRKQKKK